MRRGRGPPPPRRRGRHPGCSRGQVSRRPPRRRSAAPSLRVPGSRRWCPGAAAAHRRGSGCAPWSRPPHQPPPRSPRTGRTATAAIRCPCRRPRTAATAGVRRRSRRARRRRSSVCPSGVSRRPASLRTATTRPREVAETVTASSSGSLTQPAADSERPAPHPISRDSANPVAARGNRPPPSARTSTSSPARNNSIARPRSATIWTERSGSSHPSAEGPTATPSTISRTTAGIFSRGAKPRASGASKAMTSTPSRLPKSMSGIRPQSRQDGICYVAFQSRKASSNRSSAAGSTVSGSILPTRRIVSRNCSR